MNEVQKAVASASHGRMAKFQTNPEMIHGSNFDKKNSAWKEELRLKLVEQAEQSIANGQLIVKGPYVRRDRRWLVLRLVQVLQNGKSAQKDISVTPEESHKLKSFYASVE